MRKIAYCLLFIVFCIQLAVPAYADYVLPYPSYMPGNKLYVVSRVIDSLKSYWYWGNIAKIKYHMALADKYLVESKTLFEYKQYLLASQALARSDSHIDRILPYVRAAAAQGKDIRIFEVTIADEMLAHISVIEMMRSQLPEEFVWRPEKASATTLPIFSMLQHALVARQVLHDAVTVPVKSYSYVGR